MRKIKANFFISLDGVVEAPDQWHFSYFNDEMGAAIGAGAAGVDAYLMGRVLYEDRAAYWPEHADEPFGGRAQLDQEARRLRQPDQRRLGELRDRQRRRRVQARRAQGPGWRRHRDVG